MKNKKNIQFVFKRILLACLFVVSIFSAFNFGKALASIDDIVITNATIVDKSTTTDATITNFNRDGLETSVIYRNVNDYVDFLITIKNNDSKKYTVKTITDNNSNPNIVYEYDKHENEDFNSGSELDLSIKATYKTSITNKNDREVNEFDGIEKSLEEEEKKNEKSFESKNEKKKNKEIEKNYIKVISKYKDSKMKNEEMEKKLENLKKEKEEEKKEYIKKERYKFFLFLSVIIVFFISVFYNLFFKKTDTIITIRLGSSSSEIYPGYETEEEDKSDSIPSEIVYDIKLKKGDLNLNFNKENNNKLYFFKFDFSSPNEKSYGCYFQW